ncbi:uncharacterized protein [Diadema setosum]|uniref:uncharacterized protein isoform X1 n=1 Tax=Diadema setosum TaxID=31175 RepID=UPI003B3A5C91
MESAWMRRLACISSDPEVPMGRGVVSVAVMTFIHILIWSEKQAIPTFMPAGLRCLNQSCPTHQNVTVSTNYHKTECVEMTLIQEGVLLGPLVGLALLFVPPSAQLLSAATCGSHVSLITTGGLLWSAMVLLTSYCRSFWELILARLGVSIGFSVCLSSSASLQSVLFTSSTHSQQAANVFHQAVFVGGFAGYLLGLTYLTTTWRQIIFVLGVAGFGVFLVASLVVRQPNSEQRDFIFRRNTACETLLELVACKPYVMLCVAVIVRNIGSCALDAWLATFYAQVYQIPPKEYVTRLGVVVVVGGCGGSLLGTLLLSRCNKKNKVAPVFLVSLGQLSAASFALPALLLGSKTSPAVFTGLLFLVYLFAETWWNCVFAVCEACFHQQMRDQAVTFCLRSGLVFGNIAGPLLVPALSHLHPEWLYCEGGIQTPLLYVTTTCLALSALFFFLLGFLLMRLDTGPRLEETIYLMYETSDVDAFSEKYSEKDSSF